MQTSSESRAQMDTQGDSGADWIESVMLIPRRLLFIKARRKVVERLVFYSLANPRHVGLVVREIVNRTEL